MARLSKADESIRSKFDDEIVDAAENILDHYGLADDDIAEIVDEIRTALEANNLPLGWEKRRES